MSNIVVLFWLNLMLEVEYWWSTLVMLNLMLVMLNWMDMWLNFR